MKRNRVLSVALEIALALAAFALAFGLAYLLGNKILLGNLQGNDSPLHVGYAVWLDRYFPEVPDWYPLQGAGISLAHGYPVLSHLLVVVAHRATGLSLPVAFRWISFLSFPLTGLGLYVFGRIVFRRRTIGLLAELIFLLSPVSWTWMYNWGFFAQQVAFILVPYALVAFDRAWDTDAPPNRSGSRRLWLVALCVLMVLASLCHLLVGFAAGAAMGLYVIAASLIAGKGHRRRQLMSGLKVLILAGILVGLIAAAYLVPFYRYGSFTNREGLNTPPEEQLHRLPVDSFLGLVPIDRLEILTRMQFPLAAIVAAAIGILASAQLRRPGEHASAKPLALALTMVFAVVFALVPALPAVILRLSPTAFLFMNFRSMLIVAMVLIPVMAAFGICRLADLAQVSLQLVLDRSQDASIVGSQRPAWAAALSSGSALTAAAAALLVLAGPASVAQGHLPYGPQADGVDLRDIWDAGIEQQEVPLSAQLALSSWPALSVRQDDPLTEQTRQLASLLPGDRHVRIDISPYEGRLAMDLATFTDASQINTYTFTASLFHRMWGYQQNVYYSREAESEEYGNPQSLKNAAAWFGTEYVYLDQNQDPTEIYDAAGWPVAFSEGELELRSNPDPKPLAEFIDRPVFLVVSKPETDGYMNIFRLANDGLLEFQDALLVEGDPRIDDYTIEQLQQFDALFLYGYDYRDGEAAWSMLQQYVSGGGSVFVDTGWEFWIPEWEFESAPEVLPLSRLSWTNYGDRPAFEILAPEIAGDIDPAALKPLEWEGQPWTVSGASVDDLRDWGQVVLAANGAPLVVAGQLGKGRIVWSGMNLLAHAQYQGINVEELGLIHNLLEWLAPLRPSQESNSVAVNRPDPDHVELGISSGTDQQGWLFWRESQYPRWSAIASDAAGSRSLPIYRAGPGFMLMPVELHSGATVVDLSYVPSLDERIAVLASGLGMILLLASTLDGLFLEGKGLTWLKLALITRIPRPFLGDEVSKEWVEKKRNQIRSGEFAHGPHHYDPSEAVPWMRAEGADRAASDGHAVQAPPSGAEAGLPVDHGDGAVRSAAQQPPTAPATASPTTEGQAQEDILQSWLEDTGHQDDEWATKLLGGGRKSLRD